MERQEMKFLLLALPLTFLAVACQAGADSPAPTPAPHHASIYRDRFIPPPVKETVKKELLRFLGRPPTAVSETTDWMENAVEYALEKLNWPYNIPIDEAGPRPDLAIVEDAGMNILAVIKWFLSDYQLNPYKSLTQGLPSFDKLFKYMESLQKGEAYGGEKNPVYKCFNIFNPKCEERLPKSLMDALIFRFDCSWEFYDKCQLQYWLEDGNWKVPDFNALLPPPPPIRAD